MGNTIRLMDNEYKAVVEDKALPDYINTFFARIGNKLAGKFSDEWVPDLQKYYGE